MKKLLFGLVAAAGMLFATSCAQDIDGVGVPSGGDATVTFNVGLENAISTRAISDGNTVDKLYYAAFNEDGDFASDEVATADIENGVVKGEIKLPLENGKTYKVAFWAQKDGAGYTVGDNMAITVSYAGAKNNDDSRDAFYALKEVTVSDNSASVDVTLTRAVAQINLGVKSEKLPTETQMVVDKAYTKFNVFTGEASGEAEATFAYAAPLKEELKATPESEEEAYKYLSMSYLLINEKDNFDVSFSFKKEGGATDEYSRSAVPVRRNYRTNLLGIFVEDANEVEFDVTLDSSWGGEEDDENLIIGEDDGDDDNDAPFTVSKLSVNVEEQTVSFEAEYTYEGDGKVEAWFVCTPDAAVGAALTRADDGTIEVEAKNGEKGKLTATENVDKFKAGVKYNVTLKVEIDGEATEVETSGEAENNTPEITVPEEQGGNDGDDDGDEDVIMPNYESQEMFTAGNESAADKAVTITTKDNNSTVNGLNATGLKFGNSSAGGTFTTNAVGVKGDKYLSFYAWAWSGKTCDLTVSIENGGTFAEGGTEKTVSLNANDGFSGNNSYYNITNAEGNFYSMQIKDLTADSKITIKANSRALLVRTHLTTKELEPVAGSGNTGEGDNTEEGGDAGEGGDTTYTFKKVTSTEELESGDYLIVCEDKNVAFNGALQALDVANNYVNVTIKDGAITTSDDAAVFTYDKTAGTLKSASGFYIGQTSNNNGLLTNNNTTYANTVTVTNGVANIAVSAGPALKFNSASDQMRFRYYKSGQTDVQLYKKVK